MRLWEERRNEAGRRVAARKAAAAARGRRRVRIAVYYPLQVAMEINRRRRCAALVQACWHGCRARRHVAAMLLVKFVYQGVIPFQAEARRFLCMRRYRHMKEAV